MNHSAFSSTNTFKSLRALFACALLVVLSKASYATEVRQLSFTAFVPAAGACELSELGFMSNSSAKQFKGTITVEKRGPLCTVSIPRQLFNRTYQYCALAFVEVGAKTDYVCGVTHFEKSSVEFSYGFKYGEVEPPMCSFVCPRAKP